MQYSALVERFLPSIFQINGVLWSPAAFDIARGLQINEFNQGGQSPAPKGAGL
jgi:hypothetical protein